MDCDGSWPNNSNGFTFRDSANEASVLSKAGVVTRLNSSDIIFGSPVKMIIFVLLMLLHSYISKLLVFCQ